MIRNAMGLMFVCVVAACAVAPTASQDPMQGEALDEIVVSNPDEALVTVPASPDAITPASCIAPSTCPGFSCGSWSTPTGVCSSTCTTQKCVEGNIERLVENSFRVCFNATGQMCTEWRLENAAQCGCD